MREDTAQWLKQAPVAALQCRDLRHAWPRPTKPGGRGQTPPSEERITWKRLEPVGGVPVYERVMICTAGCGVRRVEVFVHRVDALVRAGKPRMVYPPAYRRRRPDADTPLEHLDADLLRGSVIARMYPRLRW